MNQTLFTIGIEEEFQIIDPETRELKSRVNEMLEEGQMLLGEQIKPEMHQCMIEVGTGICNNVQEARQDLFNLRRTISDLATRQGLRCRHGREDARLGMPKSATG